MMSPRTAHNAFELDPESYDALVDWPRRLANEEPFYRQLFEQFGVQRVLDAACGTGHHAAMFHTWGLDVEGADASAAMTEFCRARHGESERLRWKTRPFFEPASPAGSYDVVVCVGNSLSLAPDVTAIGRALRAMLASIRPGGVCVVQVLNLWRLDEGPTNWPKCVRVQRGESTQLLIKGLHRTGGVGHIDLIDIRTQAGGPTTHFHAATFLGIHADELAAAADSAGGRDVRLYGTFKHEPYNPKTSPDLILVCQRA